MDVLHVIHQFAPETRGGSEGYVLEVARAQRQGGLDAQVLAGSMQWRPQAELAGPAPVEGVPVFRLHRDDLYFDHHVKAWHPGVTELFRGLLRAHRPRVVHLHHWVRLSSDLVVTAHEEGVPVVITLHDFYTSCPRAFRQRPGDAACKRPVGAASCWDCVPKYGHESRGELELGVELFAQSYRAELAHAARVLVAVGTVADLLAATTGVPRARYEVLPLGYAPRFPGLPRLAAHRPGQERFRFAFWGGVGRHKGVRHLIDGYRALCGRHDDCDLHVLGGFETPEYEQELRAAAAGLRVTFHGAFDPAQLRAVAPHCGVFPSTCLETFGIVIDECFELGLPCITSDLGALPGRVGKAGLVTPANDVEALLTAMDLLASNRDRWQELRAAIPPPPPSLAEHVAALATIYGAASPPATPFTGPVPLLGRLHFLQVQRDTALTRLCPPGGPR
jgi:glycosyltransferase involved in cell wall biosynthesis